MTEFRPLANGVMAAGQLEIDDIARAKEAGVGLIINNRPDDEMPGQPKGADIEAAARAEGIAYKAIPVTAAGFSLPQIEQMQSALKSAEGKTLAFCRSGTRSTTLWALAEAKSGRDPGTIAAEAAAAGYDMSGIRPTMDMLSQQSGG